MSEIVVVQKADLVSAIEDVVRRLMLEHIAQEKAAREDAAVEQPLHRMTVKQAARRFGYTESALRNRISKGGDIPVHRDRGSVYFIQQEFEEWLKR